MYAFFTPNMIVGVPKINNNNNNNKQQVNMYNVPRGGLTLKLIN